MYLDVTPNGVAVAEADDLRRLHVAAAGLSNAAIADALAGAGLGEPADDDHVYLNLVALRALAEPQATADDWLSGWQALVDYARAENWLSPDGSAVRAHLDRG